MFFSIVIPTFHRKKELSNCLDCIAPYIISTFQKDNGLQIEVIVCDDGCDTALKYFLSSKYHWVEYVEGPARGPASNRNCGAKKAKGDWIVFTDDDCLPQRGWIEAYAALADQCDVMEGKTSAFGIRTRIDQECPVNENGGYLWSCNFAIKRNLFFSLNCFSEDFPGPAMEDVEFNLRIRKAGLMLSFVPKALVLHPWRVRKGHAYAKVHSLSVAKFVSLHPEMATNFSLVRQATMFMRLLRSNMKLVLSSGRPQGLGRQVFLDLYGSLLTWFFVRKLTSS